MKSIISIVTPSLNQAAYISDTIESVLSQKGDFYIDYVIVDGGSDDGSKEIIETYENLLKKNSRIEKISGLEFYKRKPNAKLNKCKGISYRWFSEKDEGHGHALNKGFSISIGDVMGWLNSDDVYIDGAFQNVITAFNQFSQVSWITGINSHINKDGTKRQTSFLTINNYKNVYSFLSNDYEFIQQESTLWKRDLWEKAGGYINTSYKLMVDSELWCRFFLHDTIYHLKREIAAYRWHDSNRGVRFSEQVKAESLKAVQWLEQQVDSETLNAAKNFTENAPIKPVSNFDPDFLIIDKTPDSDTWEIYKVDFHIYSSKRRFLKIQANQNIYNQNIKVKDNLITQNDKAIAEKDETIKKLKQYTIEAEKLANEKEILEKDYKKFIEQQEKLLKQSLIDISLLVKRLNEKDISLEKRSNDLEKLKQDFYSKHLEVEKQNAKIEHLANENAKNIKHLEVNANEINTLNEEVLSLKLSLKDSESEAKQLNSEISSLKLSVKEKESQAKQRDAEIASLKLDLKEKESHVEKIVKEVGSLKLFIKDSESETKQLYSEIASLKLSIEEKESQVKQKDSEIASLKLILKDKESRVEKLEPEVASLKLYIEEQQSEVATLALSLKEKDSQLLKLESIIAELKNELNTYTALSEKQQKQLAALQVKLQNTKEFKSRLQEENALLNSKLISAREKEMRLTETNRNLDTQIQELRDFIKGIEKSYTFRIGKAIIWPASKIKHALKSK